MNIVVTKTIHKSSYFYITDFIVKLKLNLNEDVDSVPSMLFTRHILQIDPDLVRDQIYEAMIAKLND